MKNEPQQLKVQDAKHEWHIVNVFIRHPGVPLAGNQKIKKMVLEYMPE